MAKTINSNKITFGKKSKGRKGVHSKNNSSWNPRSKNYKKKYNGQGR